MQVNDAIDRWMAVSRELGSSASWQNLWTSRAVHGAAVELPYIIGYSNANSSLGWYAYIRDVNRSTANQSSGAAQLRGIPSIAWLNFRTDRTLLAEPAVEVGDGPQGRRVYDFLMSTRGADYRRPGSGAREILCAWAAVGSSALGSS